MKKDGDQNLKCKLGMGSLHKHILGTDIEGALNFLVSMTIIHLHWSSQGVAGYRGYGEGFDSSFFGQLPLETPNSFTRETKTTVAGTEKGVPLSPSPCGYFCSSGMF